MLIVLYKICSRWKNFSSTHHIVQCCKLRCKFAFKMPKAGYYAVRIGRNPGVYNSWSDCEVQVKGFPNAVYKKFQTLELAYDFLRDSKQNSSNLKSSRSEIHTSGDIDNQNKSLLKSGFADTVLPVALSVSDFPSIPAEITYSSNSKKDCYYAVHRGKRPGVYRTWTECHMQTKDERNASYRKFDNEKDALEYVKTGGIVKANKWELETTNYENRVKRKQLSPESEKYEYVLVNPHEPVVIFTDGASSENGKRRSRAGIGVYWGPNHPLNTSKRITGRQTNNRSEIYAAVHALHQAKQIGAQKVKLYTDSQFLIHSVTDWMKKWKSNGWKLASGKDVVNKEDFIELSAAEEGLDVEWIYVKAHARIKGNEEADKLAVAGSRLLLKPENCSEFQNVLHDVLKDIELDPFLISDIRADQEPLILPSVSNEKVPFYAVHRGIHPGVYRTFTECEQQVKDFPCPSFRKFFSENEAKEFVKTGKVVKKLKIPQCSENEFVSVYTDGAASCNGKEGAKAGIGVYWGPENELNTSMRLPGRQTNNRAEIYAAIHALKQANQLGLKNIRLYTDSKFVINGITDWIDKWKKNEWKLSNNKPVVNKDDFIALESACEGLNIDWCYVKGHHDNPGNIEADKLAVAGCNKSLSETFILA